MELKISHHDAPVRVLRPSDRGGRTPVYAVWELTLQCNLACSHCGSRAGKKRTGELSTSEALALVEDLRGLGVRELALIGGEAYLRGDWIEIVRRARDLGIRPVLQSGGYGFTATLAQRAKEAGLAALGISVDGLEPIHDDIRGVVGSYRAAFEALNAAREVGLTVTANTQIHAKNWRSLPDIYTDLRKAQIAAWQLQLTVAMGNAADNDDLLLQPFHLYELFPVIAALTDMAKTENVQIYPGNNIGFFGPYEHLWRGPHRFDNHYKGCQAGINTIGIEADGTIKGCPSLATSRYSEGNVRVVPIKEIWNGNLAFPLNRDWDLKLWGFCKTCYYAKVCRGGCNWTSDSLFGKPGNNPYCHHRVLSLKKLGKRERVVKVSEADKSSFGTGLFKLIEESW
ncbi:heme/metallo cofactor biosynthesis-like protein [Caballeronia pedi]|uniref:Heme/metallo cofactor biosynthesis-like protein n=1 Tax=Caballeronia pedi TaxID=1777141 RepID=A0A158E5N0_9BURK|nr:radical SAM protein [Caballeronia pedi]SAL02149.1 heme/metallo cofactor biosynthesis-like protein [Caballeronia pedi]